MYGAGISREGEIIELGSTHNIIDKSGSWYAYKGERIGQGKDNTRDYLKQHPAIAREIEDQIRAKLLIPKGGPSRPTREASSDVVQFPKGGR